MNLSANQLTGSIPAELGRLTNLRALHLSLNKLTGQIPPELGNLISLQTLWLTGNLFGGRIPPELGRLANLKELALGATGLNAEKLTGPIPTELGDLTNLEILLLSGNPLSGPIPAGLGMLANLRRLGIDNTNLSGPFPSSFLRLSLQSFRWNTAAESLCAPGTAAFAEWIQGIERTEGPFCNASDRAALEGLFESAGGTGWADSQGWLSGPALAEWRGVQADSLGRVTALDLSDNGLAGRLPGKLGNLDVMTELRIGGNPSLSGTLPLSLARLPLRVLDYGGTALCAPARAAFRAWLSTLPSHEGTGTECEVSERDLLVTLYEETGGPDWFFADNWLTDAPLEEWDGVRTDDQGRVVELYLAHKGLTGRLPAEIGGFAHLRTLDLGFNPGLIGGFPAAVGDLARLEHLDAGGCGFSGTIPPALGELANLKTLDLSGSNLEGEIPAEIGNLSNLESLVLGVTGGLGISDLSGRIPPQLGRLAKLRELRINKTKLSGPIPPQLGNLSDLEILDLSQNFLSGPIPAELGGLANLDSLKIETNRFSGPIPAELGGLAKLSKLTAARNALTGSLPPELGTLANLEVLNLNANLLSGPVPASFGGLARLRELFVGDNADMSGALPDSLTTLDSLDTFQAGGTGLCAPAGAGLPDPGRAVA